MKIFSTGLLSLFLFSIALFLNASEVVITPSHGESFILDIEPTASFLEVVGEIQNHLIVSELNGLNEGYTDLNKEMSFSYTLGLPGIFASKVKPKGPRNYLAPATESEKEGIRYVVRCLAKYNWTQLAKEQSSLKKTGDKIHHVHPLRFLQVIFTEEEMKAGIYVVRNKSLVWGDYYNGMRKSLDEESDNNNLLQFVPDFANNIGVNVHTIMPLIQNRQWTALVDTLISNIPRQGNPDRYGM